MNNKYIIRAFYMLWVIILLFFSCQDNNNKIIDEKNIGDVKDKQSIEYFPNGVIKSKYDYKDGKKNGKFVRYYQNSSIMEYGVFVNDELEGYVYSFSESGDTVSISKFSNGNLLEFVRYEEGKKSMKADHVEKTFTRYDDNGIIIDISPL